MVDKNCTNTEELFQNCLKDAPTKPLGLIETGIDVTSDDNVFIDQITQDNKYEVTEKFAHEIVPGDMIIKWNGCGVIRVETVVHDDYCDSGLFVEKYYLPIEGKKFILHRPLDGQKDIFVKDVCHRNCEYICCEGDDIVFEIDECSDDIEVFACFDECCPCCDDFSVFVNDLNDCIDDFDYFVDGETTTTTTTELLTTTTSTTDSPTTTTTTTEVETTITSTTEVPTTTTTTTESNITEYCVFFDWFGDGAIPTAAGHAYSDNSNPALITEFYLYDVGCGSADFQTLASMMTTGYQLTVSRLGSDAIYTVNGFTENVIDNYWTVSVTYVSGTVTESNPGAPCHQPCGFCFENPEIT